MPINVHNIHWYLACVQIHNNEVTLNIHNDIDMRNKIAEGKLLNIARKYLDTLVSQHVQKKTDTVGEHQSTLESQPEEAGYDDFLQFYYDTKYQDNTSTQINPKNAKVESHTSERKSSEYRKVSQIREVHLHRTRQLKTKVTV